MIQNKIFISKIQKMKNYALITEGINNLLVEFYGKKDKKNIKALLTEIKSNKEIKYLYTIVDNLKNGEVSPQSVDSFINENIKAAKELDLSILDNLLDEGVLRTDSTNEIIDSIGYILFENKTVFNLSEYTKAYEEVKTHLIEKNTWKDNLRNELLKCEADYSTLDSEDKLLFENFFKSNKTEKLKLYKEMKEECLSLISEHIKNETNATTKVNLYETKEVITEMKDDDENYVQYIAKLHDLKKKLI